jgi:hypothetical protein
VGARGLWRRSCTVCLFAQLKPNDRTRRYACLPSQPLTNCRRSRVACGHAECGGRGGATAACRQVAAAVLAAGRPVVCAASSPRPPTSTAFDLPAAAPRRYIPDVRQINERWPVRSLGNRAGHLAPHCTGAQQVLGSALGDVPMAFIRLPLSNRRRPRLPTAPDRCRSSTPAA